MTTKLPDSNREFPRFISNRPCGEDKFDGNSQQRLAESIAEHFKRNDALPKEDALPRIIGVEGGWGSGKSNVVKLLKDKYLTKYHFFEYDAWGHQEDLQRRSFLELLTEELIDKKILIGKSKSFVNNKSISWGEKLKELLAKRVVRINKSLPQFNAGAFWTALFLALTPITVFLSEKLSELDIISNIPILLLIAFAPILVGLVVWGTVCICDKDARSFGYLLKISKTEDVETKNFETINEDDPTAIKFRRWMNDVSQSIELNNKE